LTLAIIDWLEVKRCWQRLAADGGVNKVQIWLSPHWQHSTPRQLQSNSTSILPNPMLLTGYKKTQQGKLLQNFNENHVPMFMVQNS
jgi:hypothetical protein